LDFSILPLKESLFNLKEDIIFLKKTGVKGIHNLFCIPSGLVKPGLSRKNDSYASFRGRISSLILSALNRKHEQN
jgi:hypothetical protein